MPTDPALFRQAEDRLYRSQHLREGRFDEAIREIIEVVSAAMQVERMNIWRIDENFRSISSIGNYDIKTGMLPNLTLHRNTMPEYFGLLESAEIIVTADSAHDPKTRELAEGYIVPNGIISMMDVPIRIEGRMIGVVCFEETKQRRDWSVEERQFGISVAQIIALTLETHTRRQTQKHLEAALAEKQLLLREVNHRVKNNFDLISDILRLHAEAARDEYHRQLFDDCLARLSSIGTTHRLLYQGDSISTVNFRDFLLDLCSTYRPLLSDAGIKLITLLDPMMLPMSKAVCAGLVVNELLSNAVKHAFDKKENNTITVKLQQFANKVSLKVSDNGRQNGDKIKNSTGLSLVSELAERLEGSLEQENGNGNHFTLKFVMN
ncbi:MAG: signal transduction histidine kinase [Bacteroidetes bacterium]|nr:MAG: signal transduction histidine kinase [Bacteroidota bacterium]